MKILDVQPGIASTLRLLGMGVLVVLLAVGCGGDPEGEPTTNSIAEQTTDASGAADPPAESSTARPEVLESGFGQDEYGGGTIVSVIRNPSTSEGATVIVAGTAYDAAGQVVGTSSGNILLRSGETGATADFLSVPEGMKIDRVTVQASNAESYPDEHPDSVITTRGVQVVENDGSFTANGEVVSAYTSDLRDVSATAVCRDAAGTIIGGGFTFVDLLPGGGASGASISLTVPAKPDTCDMYAVLSNLSVLANQGN